MNFIPLETGFPVRVISNPSNTWSDPVVLVAIISACITLGLWTLAAINIGMERRTFRILNNPSVAVGRVFLDMSRTKIGQFGVGVIYMNFGKTVAREVQFIGRWATVEEYLLADMTLNMNPVIYQSATPNVPMNNFILFQKGRAVLADGITTIEKDANYAFNAIREGKMLLFVRCEVYYKGLDNKEYVNYYFGKYDSEENDFWALRNYAGKVSECKENIAKSPKPYPHQNDSQHEPVVLVNKIVKADAEPTIPKG